ncbi:hypothetical protein RCO48_24800 [Peribacillus frigoritolerans]|nr:hypothetical protein [Peribacillus frigoritolerans]
MKLKHLEANGMRRRERTEILIQGSEDIAKEFAKEIAMKYKVTIIQKPESALVLLKTRENGKKELVLSRGKCW